MTVWGRLPRCARNDSLGKVGTREASRRSVSGIAAWFDRLTRSGGAVVVGVFLLWLVGRWFGWLADFGFWGSGCRRYGQRAWLRIDLLGLRVLTAPCPAPPGFRCATGASATRHRRIFDTPQAHLRHATGASSTCAGMTPCQARGRLGAEGDPRAAVVRPAVLVYAVPGILPAFAIASGAMKIRRAVRHRRICDHVR